MSFKRFIRAVVPLALLAGSLAGAPAASAHTHFQVGPYELTIGWGNEPTYVGVPNFVEVTIEDANGEPVTDLAAGDVTVVVSTAGTSSTALPLEPRFRVGAFGTPGQYGADLLPTVPGEYTFQFGGSIKGEPVDVTVTSGEDTFSGVLSSSDVEFPVKVPTLADVATRLDRIDGRIEALPGQDAFDEVVARADGAAAAANQALLVGALVGGAGLVVAILALAIAWRATRRGAGTA